MVDFSRRSMSVARWRIAIYWGAPHSSVSRTASIFPITQNTEVWVVLLAMQAAETYSKSLRVFWILFRGEGIWLAVLY